jgi:hypothetical protein
MRLLTASLSTGLILTIAFSSALGQGANEVREKSQDTARSRATPQTADGETKAAPAPTTTTPPIASTPIAPQDEPSIVVHFVGGGRMQVDELTERADGFWYKRGNVTTLLDKTRVERIERIARPDKVQAGAPLETLAGGWSITDSTRVEDFFMLRFNHRLPLTAFGQSELHTRWGLDHRQGIDVGLHPDSPEGRVLINFLRSEKIPFLAFRSAVPGVATGPHIHIGKGSHRLSAR